MTTGTPHYLICSSQSFFELNILSFKMLLEGLVKITEKLTRTLPNAKTKNR